MAIYCPIYDPDDGWHIVINGPNGPEKQLIKSPLYYYYIMGVDPPIGASFTEDDYETFEVDQYLEEINEELEVELFQSHLLSTPPSSPFDAELDDSSVLDQELYVPEPFPSCTSNFSPTPSLTTSLEYIPQNITANLPQYCLQHSSQNFASQSFPAHLPQCSSQSSTSHPPESFAILELPLSTNASHSISKNENKSTSSYDDSHHTQSPDDKYFIS